VPIRIKRDESHLLPARKKTTVHGHYRDDHYSERRQQFRGAVVDEVSLSLSPPLSFSRKRRRRSKEQSRGKLQGIKPNARRPWDSAGKHLCGYIPEQPDLIDSLTSVFKKRSSLDPGINKPRKRRRRPAIPRTRENFLILFIEIPPPPPSPPKLSSDVTALTPYYRRDRSINIGNVSSSPTNGREVRSVSVGIVHTSKPFRSLFDLTHVFGKQNNNSDGW